MAKEKGLLLKAVLSDINGIVKYVLRRAGFAPAVEHATLNRRAGAFSGVFAIYEFLNFIIL